MAISGKNYRTKWRYIAPKITPNEAGLNSSIRENRPVKFSPPKSEDSSQDHSFLKREQLLHQIRMKRYNSNQNSLHESRQQLTYNQIPPSSPNAVASFMKEDDHLQIRKENEFETGQTNLHGLCSCIELKETYNLVKQIKESFLQFQKEIMGQIKIYEQMFQDEIRKIYEFMTKYANDHKQTRMESQSLAKIEEQPSLISLESQETPKQIQNVEKSKIYETESRLITNEAPITQRQRRQVEFQPYIYKSSANFDRFFEIMQAMKDTLDRRVMPYSHLSIQN